MGGGDLNLKKSWHPSTLRNIERVWKAEQKHEVEKQKIEQLQRELAEERAREEIQQYAEDQGVVKKREERLDWMYKGPGAMVNRDEYLLGRKIDKSLELLQQQETGKEPEKDDLDIGATMFSSQDLSGTATVDLANKIREDPLFSIMKKEKEQRKNLLNNPVKMKQLQQMLQQSLGKDKNKKNKKHKKKHSDSDSEEKKHHKRHKKNKQKHNYAESGDERMSSKDKHQDSYLKRKNTSSDEDKYHRKNSSSSYEKKYHHNPDFRDKGDYHSSRYKNSDNHAYRGSSTSENYSRNTSNYRDRDSKEAQKRKLDDEERDRRLREMQENAKWREEQRERNFKRYKEEDDREEKANQGHKSDFIKPLLSKAVEKGSLENRVRQKIFSIQKTSADMQKNFMKR